MSAVAAGGRGASRRRGRPVARRICRRRSARGRARQIKIIGQGLRSPTEPHQNKDGHIMK
eukprot:8888911-Pyramimonas_sp.AAC.1